VVVLRTAKRDKRLWFMKILLRLVFSLAELSYNNKNGCRLVKVSGSSAGAINFWEYCEDKENRPSLT